ncbi:hypothetical protein AAFF_G00306550 [Aldrovandia affinis]|uniref:Immunoglobulin C1-set domain-containing protein n=1 Tax=Aldrovandia affinis TaxID=143900 RepID=A0AAD7R7Z3_9TELE|nr:hypothetical protein AAFF_G00306550 [Aldrovandia affinis]
MEHATLILRLRSVSVFRQSPRVHRGTVRSGPQVAMVLLTAPLSALLLALCGTQALVLTQDKSLSVSPQANVKMPCSGKGRVSFPAQWVFALSCITVRHNLWRRNEAECPDSLSICPHSDPVAPVPRGAVRGQGHPGVPGAGLLPRLGDRVVDAGRPPVAGDGVRTSEPQRQADGTYSTSSLLTLTASQWTSGRPVSCQLSHSVLASPVSRALSQGECDSQG